MTKTDLDILRVNPKLIVKLQPDGTNFGSDMTYRFEKIYVLLCVDFQVPALLFSRGNSLLQKFGARLLGGDCNAIRAAAFANHGFVGRIDRYR